MRERQEVQEVLRGSGDAKLNAARQSLAGARPYSGVPVIWPLKAELVALAGQVRGVLVQPFDAPLPGDLLAALEGR